MPVHSRTTESFRFGATPSQIGSVATQSIKTHDMDGHRRFSDEQAHERALRHLAECVGPECADRVCWDPDHHLQGHVDVDGRHLVVIASRDDAHDPLVLTEQEWALLRRHVAA